MKTATPIHIGDSQLAEMRHVCAFFNSDEEEYRVLLPFIKDGFECGDKAVHVVNPEQREDHLQRLAAVGIDTTATEQSGQFELRTNTEAYLRDGRFDQDRMLEVFEQVASGNARDVSRSVELCAEWTGWSIVGLTSTTSLNSNRVSTMYGAATTTRSFAPTIWGSLVETP